MKAAELIVRCLEAEGVRHIFGVPGEENIEFLKSIAKSGIQFVTARDERGASFMAAGWGRLTGRPGVCLSTLGPGAMNLLTGVADAYLDFAPMIAITAQKSLSETFREAHQYIDIMSIYKPVTKWGASIGGKNIPDIIKKAFRVAQAEKPGPVHLELPEDVACMDAPGEPLPPYQPVHPEPAKSDITAALELIKSASNPLVVAGNGVLRAGASAALLKFIRKFNLPAAVTFMALGAVPADDPLYISTVGLQQRDFITCGLEKADLIITIGFDPVEFNPASWSKKADEKMLAKSVVHISATPAEADFPFKSLELIGNVKKTLSILTRAGDFSRPAPAYFMKIRELAHNGLDIGMYGNKDGGKDGQFPPKPSRIVREMREALDKKDILISDVGAHKIWIARFYEAFSPNTVLISNGLASMGFAIPTAISAKLLCPERKVLAAVGDGGFMMSLSELETARRLGVFFPVLIFNDGAYGLIGWKERMRFGEEFSVQFGNPDFMALAGAFGAKGYRVEKPQDLGMVLREALAANTISIIDCPVDYSGNMELTKKLGSITCPM